MDEVVHEFAAVWGMLHGTLAVGEAVPGAGADDDEGETAAGSGADAAGPGAAADLEDAEVRERAAEIADVKRRVIFGAVLTAPVLFAVMAVEFFGATWMPELVMNRWFQLVLITQVMFSPAGQSTRPGGSRSRTVLRK